MNLPGIPVVAAYRSRASAASCVGVTAPVRTTARTRSEYMYVCAWYGRERSNESVNIYQQKSLLDQTYFQPLP